MASRRQFLQALLAAVPAAVVGRGFAKSARIPQILEKYTPQSGRSYVAPGTNFADHGWHLYEVGGQSLFPIYGVSGGLAPRCVSYLVRLEPRKIGIPQGSTVLAVIPIEFSELQFASMDYDERQLRNLIHQKIRWALKNVKPTLCDERGCFPMPAREA